MGIDLAAVRSGRVGSVLFAVDDIPEDEFGKLDDERPKPGIFLKQRLHPGADRGIPAIVIMDG